MFPQSPHAISELSEIVREYKAERYILQQTDADVSAERIKHLGHLIEDVEKAIAVLEKVTD